jgi:imidazolonepropionase-like amidohydrolase
MFRVLACAVALAGATFCASAETTVYRHATLFDATAPAARPGMTLVVRDGTIAQVMSDADAEGATFGDATNVDLKGKFVAPGLIDTHVHVANSGLRDVSELVLELFLSSGITTARDMAGDTRALGPLTADLRAGKILGPDLYYSAFFAGPTFFTDPRTHEATQGAVAGETAWMRAIKPDTDIARVVSEAKATGAIGIKLYANMDAATVARIVAEAQRQKMLTWAHATIFPARASEVIATGLNAVSHVYMFGYEPATDMTGTSYVNRPPVDFTTMDPAHPAITALYGAMRAKNITLDATVYVTKAIAGRQPTEDKRKERLAQFAFSLKLARAAQDAGVNVTAGSDVTLGEDFGTPGLWEELFALQNEAKFTPAETWAAATVNSAKLLGLDDRGTLEAGKRADFIVMTQDPSKGIEAIRSIVMTVKGGRSVTRAEYQVTQMMWKKMED